MIRLADKNDVISLNKMLAYFNTSTTTDEIINHPFKKYLITKKRLKFLPRIFYYQSTFRKYKS